MVGVGLSACGDVRNRGPVYRTDAGHRGRIAGSDIIAADKRTRFGPDGSGAICPLFHSRRIRHRLPRKNFFL
jgi:hypothetical protein